MSLNFDEANAVLNQAANAETAPVTTHVAKVDWRLLMAVAVAFLLVAAVVILALLWIFGSSNNATIPTTASTATTPTVIPGTMTWTMEYIPDSNTSGFGFRGTASGMDTSGLRSLIEAARPPGSPETDRRLAQLKRDTEVRFTTVDTEINGLKTRVGGVEGDVTDLKKEAQQLRLQLAGFHTQMDALKNAPTRDEGAIRDLQSRIAKVENSMRARHVPVPVYRNYCW